ncbi:MAG TPA: DUF3108 domain-containing protein [Edaphobacter sp.]
MSETPLPKRFTVFFLAMTLGVGGAFSRAQTQPQPAQKESLRDSLRDRFFPAPAPVTIPTLEPPPTNYAFPTKQTLNYVVDWRVFSAAVASFQLEQQGNTLKINASTDTVGGVTMLFPVIDRFQSSFDTKSGCSAGFSKQTQEGRRKISSDLTYKDGKQTLVERNLVKGTSKTLTASIPACVQDSLSAIFYVGSQPLTVGQNFRFPLADSMRTVTVTMKVEAREEIKTPAGTFQTLRVQPTADEGVVKNRGKIWIWYTDDARHMPVQVRASLFWGTITARLQSYETK